MLRKGVVCAVLACMSAVAFASNWQTISRNADGDVLIDVDSIVRTGNIVKVWLMQYHVTGKTSPTLPEPFYAEKQQWLLNCAGRSISVAQTLLTNKNGVPIYETHIPGAYADVAPDSQGETVLTQVCALK